MLEHFNIIYLYLKDNIKLIYNIMLLFFIPNSKSWIFPLHFLNDRKGKKKNPNKFKVHSIQSQSNLLHHPDLKCFKMIKGVLNDLESQNDFWLKDYINSLYYCILIFDIFKSWYQNYTESSKWNIETSKELGLREILQNKHS